MSLLCVLPYMVVWWSS